MIDIIKWHDASKELPTKSGDYLVKLNRPEWCERSVNTYFALPYSTVWMVFNCHDHNTLEEAAKYAFNNVGWWASLDDIETREEVIANEPI